MLTNPVNYDELPVEQRFNIEGWLTSLNLPRLLFNRVIVKADPPEQKSRFGIIIPDTAKVQTFRGVVVGIGIGSFDDKRGMHIVPQNRPGTYVSYGRHAGTEIELNGESYLFMYDEDVFVDHGWVHPVLEPAGWRLLD